jgi:prophage antirepressor-like protein
MSEIAKLTKNFEGTEVTTYFCRGRACWIARDIGKLMGYSDEGKRLTTNIGYDWRDEFIDGTDYVVIAGEELVEFKKILEVNPDSGFTYAPHLMLLFESGLHLALVKSNKPLGVRLRRFIVDEVLPQVFRDGSYLAVEMIRLELERRGLIGVGEEPGGEGGGIVN